MIFDDTNLKLTLISEDVKSYYTVRQLELENLAVSRPALGQWLLGCFSPSHHSVSLNPARGVASGRADLTVHLPSDQGAQKVGVTGASSPQSSLS